MKELGNLLYVLCAIATAMVGYQIHHSLGWAIVDFLFMPIALVKWLICHEISLSLIKQTFAFFLV